MTTDSTERSPDSALETLFYRADTVRLIYWRELSTARSAVVLTGLLAVLSFVSGLSTLSRPDIAMDGPIAAFLPIPPASVRFAGVLSAFVLAGITFGLYRKKRLAWYAALALLPPIALIPMTTLRPEDLPLLVGVIVILPLLIVNRGAFDRTLDLSSLQIASLLSAVGVTMYGMFGSYVIRDQFVEIETLSDAFYFVVVTIATVGYGDITPITTEAQWFSLSVILFGTGAYTVAIGALIVPAIERRMAAAFGNMTPARLQLLEDHVLVLGYSDLTESLLEEIGDESDVVVVTPEAEDASALDDRGIDVVTADPTDEDVLREAAIEAASGVVVATRDDAQDVLAVLAARRTNPDVRVVAAANDEKHVNKLVDVGADEVISPMAIGGRLLGRSLLEGTSPESIFESDAEDEESSV